MKTKTAQEIQDNIFRKMSADRKIKVGTQLWQLAKDLVGDKIYYGRKRKWASKQSTATAKSTRTEFSKPQTKK